jgi:O-antigen/teichoic acid export membrane protein
MSAAERSPEIIDTPEAGPAVIRGGVLRTAGFFVGLAISVLSAPLVIRHLGTEEYGRYLPALSLVSVVALIADTAMVNVAVRELSAVDRSERTNLLRNILGLRLTLSVIGLVVVLAFAAVTGYTGQQLGGMLIAGVGLVVADYQGAFQAPLGIDLRLGLLTIVELIRQIASVAAVVSLVLLGAGLVPFFAVNLAGVSVALLLAACIMRSEAPWVPRVDLATWRAIMREVLPVAAATTFGSMYFRIVLVLSPLLATARETGEFSVSFRVVEVLLAVPPLMVATALPVLTRAARDDRERLRYALGRIAEVGVIVGCWVAAMIWLLAPLAIDVVSGSRDDGAITALRFQGLSMPASFLVAAWGTGLLTLSDARALVRCNATAAAVAVALALALLPGMGAEGGALAISVTEMTLAGLYAVALRKSVQTGLPPAVVVLSVVAAAAVVLAGSLVPALVGAIVFGAAYFGVLHLLGVIPPEVLEAFLPSRRPAAEPAEG